MRVRTAHEQDAAAMARVLIESTRHAFSDFIPQETLFAFTYEESAQNWSRTLRMMQADLDSKNCLYVAETDTGEIVGVAMGGPERTQGLGYAGEVKVLVVLPGYQRQGVGSRLVETVVAHLVQQGLTSFLIRVVAPNAPARRFYEALGGQRVPEVQEQIEEDGIVLDQIAYGWPDAQYFLTDMQGVVGL